MAGAFLVKKGSDNFENFCVVHKCETVGGRRKLFPTLSK